MDASVTVRLGQFPVPEETNRDAQSDETIQDATRLASDETLIAEVSHGSKGSLAELFGRYGRVVRGVAYRVLRDSSEADDLLQDIFLLLHRKCSMFDPSRGTARFWILQMTYSRALARRRYLNSRRFYTRVDLDDAENNLAAPAISSNGQPSFCDGLLASSAWDRILENLSDDQRETLRLFFVEGYTLGEIATKLNQTRCNVKNHYFRGLERLRKQFHQSKLRGNSGA